MTKTTLEHVLLESGIGSRISSARAELGITQAFLAKHGQVSIVTQDSYERGATAPSIDYLRAIEASGVDIPFVVFGRKKSQLDMPDTSSNSFDWERLLAAHDDIEWCCERLYPKHRIRSEHRWMMMAEIFFRPIKLGR